MRPVINRYFLLAGLLLSLVWLTRNPDWEPLIVFVGALGTYIAHDVYQIHHSNIGVLGKDADIKLFNSLMEVLPSARTIKFLRDHNFGAAFQRKDLQPLYDFARTWDDPEYEFHNSKIEQRRKYLLECAHKLLDYLGANTWSETEGWQSVPKQWQETHPSRWQETIDELGRLSDNVAHDHQELIRVARRELGI